MSAGDALQLGAHRAGVPPRLQVLRLGVVDRQRDEPRSTTAGAADGPLAVQPFHGRYFPTVSSMDVNGLGPQTVPPASAMTRPITPEMTSPPTTPRRMTKSQISSPASTGICQAA